MNDLIRPAPDYAVYTSSFPKDLRALDPTGTNRCARSIRATGAGQVTVKRPDGTSVPLRFLDGETKPYQIAEITSLGTGVTEVEVAW